MEEARGNQAWLSLGSNLGAREMNLRVALRLLSSTGEIEVAKVSSLYETRPVGYTEQPDFLNLVVEVRTSLDPHALLRRCLQVEDEMGRVRETPQGPRNFDADVLLYEDVVVSDEKLVLPHPEMLKRAFVLVPLLELSPELAMPDGRRIAGRLEALPAEDKAGVVKVKEWDEAADETEDKEESLRRTGRHRQILLWAIAATMAGCITAVILVVALAYYPAHIKQMVIETDRGTIVVELEEKDAPRTCRHIETMVENGSYQGASFYYADETAALTGIEGRDATANIDASALQQAQQQDDRVSTVVDEIKLSNLRGAMGMAKPSDPQTGKPLPDSGTNEFYILKQDAPHLDTGFTVFGQVVEGMNVVDGLGVGEVITSFTLDESGRYVTIEQGTGKIVIELKPEEAPQTVQHFTDLVKEGFYQGMNWYRAEDFVAQTGSHLRSLQEASRQDVDPVMLAEEVKIVPDEIKLPLIRGAVALYFIAGEAEKQVISPPSRTEFFLLKQDLSQLQATFTVFGQVVEGMDVVDALQSGDRIIDIYLREVKR